MRINRVGRSRRGGGAEESRKEQNRAEQSRTEQSTRPKTEAQNSRWSGFGIGKSAAVGPNHGRVSNRRRTDDSHVSLRPVGARDNQTRVLCCAETLLIKAGCFRQSLACLTTPKKSKLTPAADTRWTDGKPSTHR